MTAIDVMNDQADRDRILTDLDSNMLVEAGAGSGKTTALIGRMVNMIAAGEPIAHIAAVTFTRKAANELRERFEIVLEARARGNMTSADAPDPPEVIERFRRAQHDLDRAFIGTIHAFSARLLREHPLHVALDPNFQETTGDAWNTLARTFWARWVERQQLENNPDLAKLDELGIDPRALFNAFTYLVDNADVRFEASDIPLPDHSSCRRTFDALLARARATMPSEEPEDGWDGLMLFVRRMTHRQRFADWSSICEFCADIADITKENCKIVQKRWSSDKDGKLAAKQLGEDFLAFLSESVVRVLDEWRVYRYPFVIKFVQAAVAAFKRERYAIGSLGFNDLLTLSATLLREHPDARRALGARYRRLLVDEFQDTDPIQAEICLLLASDPDQGNDWTRVIPRPGSLFLVGDPKQSIYRFRRADIQVYESVKSRIREHGQIVALTRNFRSVHPIAGFVNEYFQNVFPETASVQQAAFRPMQTVRDAKTPAIFQYRIEIPESRNKHDLCDTDAELLASWIEQRIESRERSAGDFLILTQYKEEISPCVRALSAHNIPVTATGARLPQERELRELCLVLRAIADPDNPVHVVAVLEGMFFGCSPADLYDAHCNGARFTITTDSMAVEELDEQPNEQLGEQSSTQSSTQPRASRALTQLHTWWRLSQRFSADVLIERILSDTGLLYYAASQVAGDTRAGVLLHLVEAIRASSQTGGASIGAALDLIETMLLSEADDTPLRPGRTDAVRVMNVHKAKGLEAPVVILAAPLNNDQRAASMYVRRDEGAAPIGGFIVADNKQVIAQPANWESIAEEEAAFIKAERERLLYVAVTRPREELVISRHVRSYATKAPEENRPLWSVLHPILDQCATELRLSIRPASGRRVPDCSPEDLRTRITQASTRVQNATTISITRQTVTESVKEVRAMDETYEFPRSRNRGAAWGRAVHRCVEALGRGRRADNLTTFIAAVALDEALSSDEADELTALIHHVESSPLWKEIAENPGVRFECPVMYATHEDGTLQLTEGVIDTLIPAPDGNTPAWTIVDWKTDQCDDDEWTRRSTVYTRQVQTYEQIVRTLTQTSATSRLERV